MQKTIDDIISNDWFRYMDYLSGYDKVIHYSWKKKTISRAERKEIRAMLEEIDEVTGITFKRTRKRDDDIRFISVPEITDGTSLEFDDLSHQDSTFLVDDAVVGRASATTKRMKIFFRDNDDHVSLLEKYILRHELGHTLGLGHPRGQGDHPDFTVADTIMSYNVYQGPAFFYYGFTSLDKQALQNLWGLNPEAYTVNSVIKPEDIVEII